MFLVSERGTIAVAVDGVFSDVDDLYDWSVEGEKSSVGRSTVSTISMTSGSAAKSNRSSEPSRWKPSAFPSKYVRKTVI